VNDFRLTGHQTVNGSQKRNAPACFAGPGAHIVPPLPLRFFLGLLLLGITVPFSRAQTDPASSSPIALTPIVVTAQKRGQSIEEVPLSLTAYTGAQLTELGVARFEDLAPLVPGLFISMRSPGSPSINLRGIGTDTTDPREEARISIFQDGVAISRHAATPPARSSFSTLSASRS
jgi:outer membrane receptor protein involved in Fe transport